MSQGEEHHYFYHEPISRQAQADYIQEIVAKYQKEPITDDLIKKVYDELMMEKHFGRITIPFKVKNHDNEYIEVLLDTRV
ncbi:MAG: hypothetical protein CMO81_01025 [Waddliaceae bacterium]|nr:hypothetical protein [Waddliaceae bacterium]